MSLPYTIQTIKNEDNSYFVTIKELPGCMSEGNNLQDAYTIITDAMKAWFETAIEDNIDIPLPESMQETQYSGRVLVRLQKSLHRDLIQDAQKEGISLNSYINNLIITKNTEKNILDKMTSSIYGRKHLRHKNKKELIFS